MREAGTRWGRAGWLGLGALTVAACAIEPPAGEAKVVHARFDPKAGVIPKPNDILRKNERIAIPAEPADLEGKTPAEAAFIRALNRLDGWPTTMAAEIPFSGALDPASLGPESVRVFEIDPDGKVTRLGLAPVGAPTNAPTKITIAPPAGGFKKGHRYVIAALGGPTGLRGADGEEVVADPAFWFLRVKSALPAHASALPGADDAEKRENAEKLEEIRLALAPHFELLGRQGVRREHVVSLFQFTTTRRGEVVMDKESAKMPIPSDFLKDPATDRVEIPIRDDEPDFAKENKRALNGMDGFALSANLIFEVTSGVDPSRLPARALELWALPETGEPRRVETALSTREGDRAVIVELVNGPLEPSTEHLVVVNDSFVDKQGEPFMPMLPGLLTNLEAPLFAAGESEVGTLDGETAARLEWIRSRVRAGMDILSSKQLIAPERVSLAWSFRTLGLGKIREARDAAARTGVDPDPHEVVRVSPAAAALDFPIGALSVFGVGDVYEGTITVPDYLDDVTRAHRPDGGFERREVDFVMAVPSNAKKDRPLKVAIFGHGLMTERRFVLALASPLAQEGIAVIAIDLPYHGRRTHCMTKGPQCLINPFVENADQLCLPACQLGTECSEQGRCVDNGGQGNALANYPIVSFPTASGAAFVDVDNLHGTRDHFYQAVTDLSALLRSLREGNWPEVIGHTIDPEIAYVGQSLGGILGSVFAAVHPDLDRVVLNVPGGDLLNLFRESTVFKPHFDAFLAREDIRLGTLEHEVALSVAHWMMDPIDPMSFAPYLSQRSFEPNQTLAERRIIIQMATLDAVIPNSATEKLAAASGVPRHDYFGEHAFLVVPIELAAYVPGTRDVVKVIAKGEMP